MDTDKYLSSPLFGKLSIGVSRQPICKDAICDPSFSLLSLSLSLFHLYLALSVNVWWILNFSMTRRGCYWPCVNLSPKYTLSKISFSLLEKQSKLTKYYTLMTLKLSSRLIKRQLIHYKSPFHFASADAAALRVSLSRPQKCVWWASSSDWFGERA